MQLNYVDEIIENIKDADMVLIGLGEEFDALGCIQNMKGYEEGKAALAESGESALIPAWQHMLRKEKTDNVFSALTSLATVLEGKNYFVVSVSTNSAVASVPWREGRLVMPCGTDLYKQCSSSCEQNLIPLSEDEQTELLDQLRCWHQKIECGDVQVPKGLGLCPVCGKKVTLNNIYNEEYDENGYLSAWQIYTKWLQGTLNRKLVVLELGVGMKFPSVIRFPFEKIGYFNQKAKFYRINKNLYHLTEELAGKGVGIADNAIDWLQNLC